MDQEHLDLIKKAQEKWSKTTAPAVDEEHEKLIKAAQYKWESDPKNSKVTAAAAGTINGGTLGLADEAGAIGSTALNAITGMSGPLAGGDLKDLLNEYRSRRDGLRSELGQIHSANPKTFLAGELAGGLVSGGLAGGAPKTVGKAITQGAKIGAVGGFGSSDADVTQGDIAGAALDTAKGTVIGGLGGGLAHGAGKAVSSVINPGQFSKGLRELAESKAVAATGATGKQASKFAPEAGRELLDRGIVKFGDDAGAVAARAEEALAESRGQIGKSLSSLDESGASLSRDEILSKLQARIDELKVDPSQSEVVRKLRGIVESVSESPESVPLSVAEKTKRGFQDLSNYNDPVATRANKTAADVYRGAVEESAQNMNPELADTFKQGKETFGLIAPIREAAERRASTLNQSPAGGLLDMTSAGAGFVKGGPVGAILAPIARRLVAPRASSSIAVGADKLADLLSKTPEAFGKFAPILQEAAAKGSRALSVTNFMLEKDPAYAQIVGGLTQSAPKNRSDEHVSAGSGALSPKLLNAIQKNPASLNAIKDEGLRSRLREELKKREPSQDGIVTDQEARDRFLNS